MADRNLVVLVGAHGSGKTTLASILRKATKHDIQICVDGSSLTNKYIIVEPCEPQVLKDLVVEGVLGAASPHTVVKVHPDGFPTKLDWEEEQDYINLCYTYSIRMTTLVNRYEDLEQGVIRLAKLLNIRS